MKKNRSAFVSVLILALAFLAGILLTRWYFNLGNAKRQEQATLLMERIKSVTQLVVLEGYFSEIYTYQDYYGFDLSFFRKKALIRVKARVSVGFDLDKLNIHADTRTKTLKMSVIPDPEILSIDHNLDYYDIQEGVFNSFSEEDYTRLNQKAKDYVRKLAMDSDLFTKALQRREDIYNTIRFLTGSMGWNLEIENDSIRPHTTPLHK